MDDALPLPRQGGIAPRETSARAYTLARFEWMTLLALFLVVGTIGHDPWWKRGEAYGFGIIYHFFTTGTWLVPLNAGIPFLEKPPLYYWTARIFMGILDGVLPLHDGARVASIFYTLIAAFFTLKSARILFRDHDAGRQASFACMLLMLGSYGFVRCCHALVTDVALLAGTAVALYGLAILCDAPERWRKAGLWLGMGLGIAFMSKGLLMPAVFGASCMALWLALPALRVRHTFYAFLIAFAVASPFFFIWPTLLYLERPDYFIEWFWQNNIGRFAGFSVAHLGAENRPFYFLWTAPVFAFPIFPLACAEAWLGRKNWRSAEYLMPAVVSGIFLMALLVSASGRASYLLPLMPGFALLGVQAWMRIPQPVLAQWTRFVQVAFSIALIATLLLWWSLLHPVDHRPLAWLPAHFKKMLTLDYMPDGSQWAAACVAAIAAAFWASSFRFSRSDRLQASYIWFAGAASLWCVINSLLMPWINEHRSYRTVLTQLNDFVQHSPYAGSCIGNNRVGENVAPMLQYFTRQPVPMVPQVWDGVTCPLLLVFTSKTDSVDLDPRWIMVWKGEQFHDMKDMDLRLYARRK